MEEFLRQSYRDFYTFAKEPRYLFVGDDRVGSEFSLVLAYELEDLPLGLLQLVGQHHHIQICMWPQLRRLKKEIRDRNPSPTIFRCPKVTLFRASNGRYQFYCRRQYPFSTTHEKMLLIDTSWFIEYIFNTFMVSFLTMLNSLFLEGEMKLELMASRDIWSLSDCFLGTQSLEFAVLDLATLF